MHINVWVGQQTVYVFKHRIRYKGIVSLTITYADSPPSWTTISPVRRYLPFVTAGQGADADTRIDLFLREMTRRASAGRLPDVLALQVGAALLVAVCFFWK